MIDYLEGIKGWGTALKAPAYQSLGGIDSGGGMTEIGLCLQFQMDSPPAFLIQVYGAAAWAGIRLAPWIWAWCTICLLLLAFFSILRHGRRIEASNANSERAAEMLCCAHQGLDPPYIARRPLPTRQHP